MTRPTIAIIGASNHKHKYGNRAVRAYLRQDYDVYPIHPHDTQIEGLPVYRSVRDLPVDRLDRVSLYLPPDKVLQVLDDIASKPVREVWLNPGTESPEVLARAEELGLPIVQACSIVAIGESPYHLG